MEARQMPAPFFIAPLFRNPIYIYSDKIGTKLYPKYLFTKFGIYAFKIKFC
jgi:hypothetical protein